MYHLNINILDKQRNKNTRSRSSFKHANANANAPLKDVNRRLKYSPQELVEHLQNEFQSQQTKTRTTVSTRLVLDYDFSVELSLCHKSAFKTTFAPRQTLFGLKRRKTFSGTVNP